MYLLKKYLPIFFIWLAGFCKLFFSEDMQTIIVLVEQRECGHLFLMVFIILYMPSSTLGKLLQYDNIYSYIPSIYS